MLDTSSTHQGTIYTAPEATRALPVTAINAQLGFLEGEILTIADAAFSDKTQGKAVKDLIRQSFRKRVNWIDSVAYDPNDKACSTAPTQNAPA